MSKRKRVDAPVSAPVSARARRLAAAAAAPEPAPAIEPAPESNEVVMEIEEVTTTSSSDEEEEESTNDVEAAERLALTGSKGQSNGRTRYFSQVEEVEEPVTEPASPISVDEQPNEPITPSKPIARPVIDAQCRSTYQPRLNVNLLHDGDARVIGLATNETVIVHGCARVKVVRGRISIAAAELDPSSAALELIAPSTHPLPVITALEDDAPSSSASATILPDFAVVIRLEPLVTGIEGIERALKMGGMLARSEQIWPAGKSFELVLEPSTGMTAQRMPAQWQSTLERLRDASSLRVIVEGAKRTGKSTLAILAVNALLSRHDSVAYLDTDLGQTELTPPGLVSLHLLDKPIVGPSFTHFHRPHRAHFLGDTSPASEPQRYSEALADLIETFDRELGAGTPLVINTQGWVKGLGEDLLRQLRTMARPTHVVHLGADGRPDPEELGDAELNDLDPISTDDLPAPRLTAADLRAISLISYFHQRSAISWDFSSPLVAHRPRLVDWQRRGPGGIDSLHVLHYRIERDHLLYALNATIVGIVALDEPSEESPDALPYLINAEAPAVDLSHCIGLAVIRGIDVESHRFHLLSPISSDDLNVPIALTRGDVELPTICMLDWTASEISVEINGQKAEYLSAAPLRASAAVGAVKRRARKNLQRR